MATSYEMLILSYCCMAYLLATWLTCCVMVKLFRYYLMAYVLRSGLLGHILDELNDDITSCGLSGYCGVFMQDWFILICMLTYVFMDWTLGRLIVQQVALGWHN